MGTYKKPSRRRIGQLLKESIFDPRLAFPTTLSLLADLNNSRYLLDKAIEELTQVKEICYYDPATFQEKLRLTISILTLLRAQREIEASE